MLLTLHYLIPQKMWWNREEFENLDVSNLAIRITDRAIQNR